MIIINMVSCAHFTSTYDQYHYIWLKSICLFSAQLVFCNSSQFLQVGLLLSKCCVLIRNVGYFLSYMQLFKPENSKLSLIVSGMYAELSIQTCMYRCSFMTSKSHHHHHGFLVDILMSVFVLKSYFILIEK